MATAANRLWLSRTLNTATYFLSARGKPGDKANPGWFVSSLTGLYELLDTPFGALPSNRKRHSSVRRTPS